jgi:hypothetical protein
MIQFLSIRGRRFTSMHNSVGTLSMKLERKANPSLPALKPELETKPKKEEEMKP